MEFDKLESSDIKDKYFYRTEKWDWLTNEMIHVFDSKSPRMITMDHWPQQIYLDATGQKTVKEYIYHFSTKYPKNKIPKELDEVILEVINGLVLEEKIVKLSEEPIDLDKSILSPMMDEGEIDLLGSWTGTYTYNIPDEYKDERTTKVEFRIRIDKIIDREFFGTVEDNLKTGGTPGLGKIHGRFIDDDISFNKNMPVLAMIDEKGNHLVDENKLHPTILYEGKFSRSKQYITGTWRFKKKKLFWKCIIPVWLSLGNGGFMMKKDEDS